MCTPAAEVFGLMASGTATGVCGGGSASYRYGLANGFTDLGGKMIDVGGGRYIDFNGEVKSVFSTVSVYDINMDLVPENGQKTFFFCIFRKSQSNLIM
jgi:hypothetical protein